jgi:transposase
MATYEANHAFGLASDVSAVDETWWRLMKKGSSKRWWVWSIAREDAVSYRLLPSRSALGKAIAYTGGLWTGLVRFLEDPKIPLDTNGVEHALRGVAVGRKNHYGSRSERGTRVAALFYSLIESAKLCSVEPRAYLREATLRAVRNPGTVTLARDLK